MAMWRDHSRFTRPGLIGTGVTTPRVRSGTRSTRPKMTRNCQCHDTGLYKTLPERQTTETRLFDISRHRQQIMNGNAVQPWDLTASTKESRHEPCAAAFRLPGYPVSRLRRDGGVRLGAHPIRCSEGNAAASDDRLGLGVPHDRGECERIFHPPDQALGTMEPDPPAGHLHADHAADRGVAGAPSRGR